MSEMKHTPTPWYFAQSGDDFYIIGKPEWPCRRNGVEQEWEICRMDDMVGEHQDEVKANAAYIVHCVNSHASLVEENARLREALNATTNMLEMTTGGQLCFNQIKHNRELVPAVKPSSAWPKPEAVK